jgi:hypothetical protein
VAAQLVSEGLHRDNDRPYSPEGLHRDDDRPFSLVTRRLPPLLSLNPRFLASCVLRSIWCLI